MHGDDRVFDMEAHFSGRAIMRSLHLAGTLGWSTLSALASIVIASGSASACPDRLIASQGRATASLAPPTIHGTWQVIGSTRLFVLSVDAAGRVAGTYQAHAATRIGGRITGSSADRGQSMSGRWIGVRPGQVTGLTDTGRVRIQVDLRNEQLTIQFWSDRHSTWQLIEFARRLRTPGR
jgi:hypothetical protein